VKARPASPRASGACAMLVRGAEPTFQETVTHDTRYVHRLRVTHQIELGSEAISGSHLGRQEYQAVEYAVNHFFQWLAQD
jgi:hypothetical protein